MSGNQALNINQGVGPQPSLAITNHGSDWYWTVCAIMGVSTLSYMGMSLTKPQSNRLFHYITSTITLVAFIAYYSMAAGLGQTPIQAEFIRSGVVQAAGTREIFYVRYIDWFVTTPLLLLDLLLTAGMPVPIIGITILADWIMVVCGLVGALTKTTYKWGYWTIGTVALLFVVYVLVFEGRRRATALGGNIGRTYTMCGVLTIFVWFLYPIAWGLSEGGNVIHPDSEAVFYGILDIFAKPVFGFMLVAGHHNIDPADLGLSLRELTSTAEQRDKHTSHANGNGRNDAGGGPTDAVTTGNDAA